MGSDRSETRGERAGARPTSGRLAPELEAALLEQARAARSLECCGLLLGAPAAPDRPSAAGEATSPSPPEPAPEAVVAILPCANVAADPARGFEIGPAALIAAHRAARAGGPPVLGCYHSHPTGIALPSAEDVAASAADGRIWAIIALDDPLDDRGPGRVSLWRAVHSGLEPLSSEGAQG